MDLLRKNSKQQAFSRHNNTTAAGLHILPTTKTKTTSPSRSSLSSSTMSSFIIILSLIICQIGYVNSARTPPPQILINKCCRIGEQLEAATKQCSIGGSDQWWPTIFMIQKQKYFQPAGQAPRFFKIAERAQPTCEGFELINEHFALFSNGSLYLGDRNLLIDNDKYCVDRDTALVCSRPQQTNEIDQQPQYANQIKIRKCCSQKAIYEVNSASCVSLSDGHEILARNLIENVTLPIEFRYGFPQCSNYSNKDIAIVGKFNASKFDEHSGNLTLAEGIFQSHQYCLEHYNDSDSINVHVFTCAENLPERKVEKVNI